MTNNKYEHTHICGNAIIKTKTLEDYYDFKKSIKTEAYKEFAEEFINYIDVGPLRDASEICLSELNVKNMVENFLKQKVGEG